MFDVLKIWQVEILFSGAYDPVIVNHIEKILIISISAYNKVQFHLQNWLSYME